MWRGEWPAGWSGRGITGEGRTGVGNYTGEVDIVTQVNWEEDKRTK